MTRFLTVLVFGVTIVAMSGTARGDDPILNPGFEGGFQANGAGNSWTAFNNGSGGSRSDGAADGASFVNSGAHSQKLVHSTFSIGVRQQFNVTPNTQYTIQVRCRCTAGNADLGVDPDGGTNFGNAHFTDTGTTAGFVTLSQTVTSGAGGVITVWLTTDGPSGIAYFDDISYSPTPVLPGKATNPSPAIGATAVSLTPTLSWTAGSNATSHDVYFGTTSPGTFIGNQPGTTYNPGTLLANTTYFWRIDEKNNVGTTTGDVWNFTTTCSAPAAPTGIAASPSTVCSGATSTLSVNNPGAGLTTDWFTGSCGGTVVPGGTGTNSVVVTVTATTTYFARTRTTTNGCVSATCQSVTVTIPNCNDGNSCTNDTCSGGVCGHTNVTNGTACADDGNTCTNDTCNNGTCTHANVANGTPCNDTNPCTDPDSCQNGTCVGGPPAVCNVTNGFDPDRIYVIREGAYESEVRMLNENAVDVLHSDLGPFGNQADKTWPITVGTLNVDSDGFAQDASLVKTICFSNSPSAGHNSPAGVRFFGVYDVRALDEPSTPDFDETTYSSAGFQIVEFNSAGKRIRVLKAGLAANTNAGNTSTDALTDMCWTGCEPGADPVDYRNNTNGCRVGTIRYNRAKNTLAVAANIGEHDNGDTSRVPVGRVYEFVLPDWPEVYYTAQNAPIPGMVGQPVPQSDPNVVNLVQIYQMPNPHSIMSENGRTGYFPHQRPAITFDDAGNLYFTTRFFNATHAPSWAGSYWSGGGLFWGDVVKCNTLGHWAGKNVYVIPVTGADAGNLVIQSEVEEALTAGYPPNSAYEGGPGLAVRGSQLVQVGEIICNDASNTQHPTFVYVNIFDLNNHVGGAYPNELLRIKSLSNDRCDIPRKPDFAQSDETSGKTFLANLMGRCDCAQNFMFVNASPVDTVVHDMGYALTVTNPNGSTAGTLSETWDAASPPAGVVDQNGACCKPGHVCEQLSQTACAAANGLWRGKGSTCGVNSSCPDGACCKPCGFCQQTFLDECTTLGGTWSGEGTVCGQGNPCALSCASPPVDGDCDGDVDGDDFAKFQQCFDPASIPNIAGTNCACFDRAGPSGNTADGVIDHFDFDVFKNCVSGPTVPAAPNCP